MLVSRTIYEESAFPVRASITGFPEATGSWRFQPGFPPHLLWFEFDIAAAHSSAGGTERSNDDNDQ